MNKRTNSDQFYILVPMENFLYNWQLCNLLNNRAVTVVVAVILVSFSLLLSAQTNLHGGANIVSLCHDVCMWICGWVTPHYLTIVSYDIAALVICQN